MVLMPPRLELTFYRPVINNGHTQMPAYAIGEKATDMILKDAKASGP